MTRRDSFSVGTATATRPPRDPVSPTAVFPCRFFQKLKSLGILVLATKHLDLRVNAAQTRRKGRQIVLSIRWLVSLICDDFFNLVLTIAINTLSYRRQLISSQLAAPLLLFQQLSVFGRSAESRPIIVGSVHNFILFHKF